ncbi:MAG: polymer-forming cytoskeletal protein [Roseburia sp.]|nr:polymer-forming cytoskeletal protein [Roseburia sp.]
MSNLDTNNGATAVIPKGTVINGNIEISDKLEMYGEINGDIHSGNYVNICGNVNGNIQANELYTKDSFIEGQIDCIQGAVVQDNTVILGDINADSLTVDGAIQGKLDIKGCVTIGAKAIVDSDIKAKSIHVDNGAAINGYCSLCYADIDANAVFPQEEPVKAPEPAKETKEEKAEPAKEQPKPEKAEPAKEAKPKAAKKS